MATVIRRVLGLDVGSHAVRALAAAGLDVVGVTGTAERSALLRAGAGRVVTSLTEVTAADLLDPPGVRSPDDRGDRRRR